MTNIVPSRCKLVWFAAKQNSVSAQDADVLPQATTKLAGWPSRFIYRSVSSSHFEAGG